MNDVSVPYSYKLPALAVAAAWCAGCSTYKIFNISSKGIAVSLNFLILLLVDAKSKKLSIISPSCHASGMSLLLNP